MGLRLGVTTGRQAQDTGADEELTDLITQVTNEIDWLMRENQITRADLAARMGVSPGRVSQVLSGGENLTLRTLASLSSALDAHFEMELRPVGVSGGQAEDTAVREAGQPVPRPATHESEFHEARLGDYSRRR
ncbi:MAG TPA: helix-turn-helix transcriptional regulator [Streptosporangiaceae bacterium]|jgi:transcriptional regulator with XRE-family HTH domain